MIRLDIKVPFPAVSTPAQLSALSQALNASGRQSILKAMGKEFVMVSLETFGASGVNRPSPWAPLSKRYQRQIRYFGPPKLILDGSLVGSIRQVSASAESTLVKVGSGKSESYAMAHQWGVGKLPARPYLPINPDRSLTDLGRKRLEDAGHKALLRAITASL